MPRMPSLATLRGLRAYAPQVAAAGAAAVVVYGLSKTMIYVTSTVLSLDMYSVFYAGFWTGVASAALFGAGALYASRAASISHRATLKLALVEVAASPDVRARLGGNLKPAALQAARLHGGHLSVTKRMAWVEPRAQLLFHVVGDAGEGMVTAEAVKHKGVTQLTLLAVDTLATPTRPSELLLLKGSEDKLHVAGTLRGFLQGERATYVSQDVLEDDDVRLREQAGLPDDAPLR